MKWVKTHQLKWTINTPDQFLNGENPKLVVDRVEVCQMNELFAATVQPHTQSLRWLDGFAGAK